MSEFPEYAVTAKWVRGALGDFYKLTFVDPCPCRERKPVRHSHGGGDDRTAISLGHRTPHCTNGYAPNAEGYILVLAGDPPPGVRVIP